MITPSRQGLWDKIYNSEHRLIDYGCNTTFIWGSKFINDDMDIKNIEDWGCGFGGLKPFIRKDIQYIGIDGSASKVADKIVDLETYRSEPDAIFMRHVLAHNPNWSKVLTNAVESFQRKMVLIIFTPWQEHETQVIREYPNWMETGVSMYDIGFKREDIIEHFEDVTWTSKEDMETHTGYGVEHIFYLSK